MLNTVPAGNYRDYGPGAVRGTQQGLETRVLSASLCLCVAWQTLVHYFFFHSHANSLSPLRSPRLLPLLLCSRRHISPCCQTVCGPHIFVYAMKLVFLLLICSMSTEFSVPPEEPRQVEEKFFLPSNCIHINHKKMKLYQVLSICKTLF